MDNPAYSGISSNKGKWITDLIEDDKYVDNKHFGEKKHWLRDDYVKFMICRMENWGREKGTKDKWENSDAEREPKH